MKTGGTHYMCIHFTDAHSALLQPYGHGILIQCSCALIHTTPFVCGSAASPLPSTSGRQTTSRGARPTSAIACFMTAGSFGVATSVTKSSRLNPMSEKSGTGFLMVPLICSEPSTSLIEADRIRPLPFTQYCTVAPFSLLRKVSSSPSTSRNCTSLGNKPLRSGSGPRSFGGTHMSCIRTDLWAAADDRCSCTKPGTKPVKIAETRMSCAIAVAGEACSHNEEVQEQTSYTKHEFGCLF